ncbi:hypothetical protein D3C81_1287780 [compost metagenome]
MNELFPGNNGIRLRGQNDGINKKKTHILYSDTIYIGVYVIRRTDGLDTASISF